MITINPMRLVSWAGILALALLPWLVGSFTISLMADIGISALVALGLVMLTGVGGMQSFGQAAFVGIGAYASAYTTTQLGWSPWLGLALALVLASVVALVLGAVTMRLEGHFLPLGTIAWGVAVYYLFGNLDLLGRFNGIAGIPPISIGWFTLSDSTHIYYLVFVCLIGAMLLCSNLLGSREGRAIRALRGGSVMMASLCIDTFRIRLTVFTLAALLAGLAGWLYAHMTRFVSPTPFDIRVGIDYLLMVMIGGAGSVIGALFGATVFTLLKDWLQDVLPLLSTTLAGQLEIVVFMVLFIFLLEYARGGLAPHLLRFVPCGKPTLPMPASALTRRRLPKPGEPILEVRDLVHRFGGLVAVDEVNFELCAGKILGLIGPNGAGKSTIFNLITGALRPASGNISFLGADVTQLPPPRIAHAGIARTFQHVKLRPKMSVIDNVLLGTYGRTRAGFLAGAFRLDRAEEKRAMQEALHQLVRVGLADVALEQAGNLPLGNQRKVEVARALAADPALILLDEPAAGLRKKEKTALSGLLRGLRNEGVTILLVEHDMDFVMGLVDHIVVMEFGSKLVEGAPAEIQRDVRVQEAYLGSVA